VRACLDVGLRPLPGMTAEALLRPDAPLDLLPTAPSRAADPARLQKASSILHRLVTICGETPVTGRARPVRIARRRGFGRAPGRCRFIDGRHLGYSGPRSSSRKNGRCSPGPRMCPRKRHMARWHSVSVARQVAEGRRR